MFMLVICPSQHLPSQVGARVSRHKTSCTLRVQTDHHIPRVFERLLPGHSRNHMDEKPYPVGTRTDVLIKKLAPLSAP
eukprot:2950451-Pyramimonas_sp.AAC.1